MGLEEGNGPKGARRERSSKPIGKPHRNAELEKRAKES